MNGKNLNVNYRRKAYAKKRARAIITIVASALVLLFVLFLIFGGILKNKVDDERQNDGSSQTDNVATDNIHTNVPSVKGYGVSLEGLSASALSDRLTQIGNAGGDCVSVVVRSSTGNELYSSSVAQGMGKQEQSNGLISADTVASRAANKGMKASALLDISAFSEKDDLERSVLLAYDAAICAELCRDGMDDVIITVRSTEINEDSIDELVRFAENVKAIESEAVVGIALSKDMLASEGSEVLVSKLWEAYDLLALDITDIGEDEDPTASAQEKVSSEIHYYLLRYNMRVLFPSLGSDRLEDVVSILSDKGLTNWQTVEK